MFNPYFNPYQNAVQSPFGVPSMNNPYQPQNTQQTAQTDATYVLPVASVKEFDSVTIQPGKRALLMAQNEPYIAFKAADAMGMVQTNLYRIEPVTAEQIAQPSTEYATKSELQQLQQVVQQIVDNITPKKSTAKKEVAE